jgi:spore coat protein CotH
MRLSRPALFALALGLSACGGTDNPGGPSDTLSGTGPFNAAVLHDIKVDMGPRDWFDLKDSFRDDYFYPADVTIDGERVPQIGVRSRGQGSRSPIKPSLKLDFNKYVSGQRYRGQKSLAVKNLTQDVSMLRDYLAMSVFEAMGIAAPKYSFARMSVNGEPMGVFNIVEDVEEPFLDSRFGQSGGNLFNYEYGIGIDIIEWYFSDRGTKVGNYVPAPFKPETNESNLDAKALVDFVQTVNHAGNASFVSDLSRYLDVDQFLTYIATENAVAERDGFIGDYGMNNFFLYQYANSTKFVIIPWDKNTSFADSHWPLTRNLSTNVLTQRLTADPAKLKVYRDAVARAGQSYVNERYLVPKLDAAYTLIKDAVHADVKKPYNNKEFDDGVQGLRGLIIAREGDIAAQTK